MSNVDCGFVDIVGIQLIEVNRVVVNNVSGRNTLLESIFFSEFFKFIDFIF